jgi:type I restriction enzyme, S subunit
MREIRPSGSMSGEWKRSVSHRVTPRLYKYVFWLLLSAQFAAWSVLESDRVAMPKINRDTLSGLHIPLPPFHEQIAIAHYLDTQALRIDTLIAKVESAIERLQEYRTALITAAVTGKIDVRRAASVS